MAEAQAYIEERHLLKSLRWWDGFVIALCNPGFLIASLGFSTAQNEMVEFEVANCSRVHAPISACSGVTGLNTSKESTVS